MKEPIRIDEELSWPEGVWLAARKRREQEAQERTDAILARVSRLESGLDNGAVLAETLRPFIRDIVRQELDNTKPERVR